MREYLAQLLAESGTLTTQEIILHITASAVLSAAIYISYWYTHAGTAYSKKFNVSLVSLTILTATVMTVIGNNIALSLGMVGALSIVRFRTASRTPGTPPTSSGPLSWASAAAWGTIWWPAWARRWSLWCSSLWAGCGTRTAFC